MRLASFCDLRVRIASVIILAVLPMLGLTLYSYLEERKMVMAHIRDDLQRIVSLIANDQEHLLDSTRQLLLALARVPEMRESDSASCRALLARLQHESPRYGNLGLVEVDGNVLCSAEPMYEYGNFAGQSWFERSIATVDFAMGTCQIGREPTDAVLIINYPLIDDGGKVRRIAFAAVDLTRFNHLMSHVQVPISAHFTMLSQTGAILSCYPDPEDCLGKSLQGTLLARVVLSKGTGTEEIMDPDGTLRLYAFVPLSSSVDTGLYVTIGLPVDVVYGPATKVFVYHFVGLSLVSLMALSMLWLGSSRLILNPVNTLVRTAQQLSGGDMTARTGLPHGNGQLERLARAFDEMAEALQVDLAERKRADHQLAEYQKQLRSLASQLSLAEEHERRRIAVDLHDRVGQALAISNIKLGGLRQLEYSNEFMGLVDEVSDLIEQAIQETRTLMFDISSPILYELGFDAAIRHLTDQIQRQHGIFITFERDPQPGPLADDLRILLFQAVRELLVNVVKHARAGHVNVRIARDGGLIQVSVKDDGIGFDASQSPKQRTSMGGFGLFSIRERLEHVGGCLLIESEPGRGTLVTLMAPFEPPGTVRASTVNTKG
jgi:signal transduction histidine kinase